MIEKMRKRFFDKGYSPFKNGMPICECENCINGRFNVNRNESNCKICLGSGDESNRSEIIRIDGIRFLKIRPYSYSKFKPISFLLEMITIKEDFLKEEEFEL